MQSASDLAADLADHAEDVCREYLSNGRRQGSYWLVGNLDNEPGRSFFVRLTGPSTGTGAAGRWTDAATGQHGDLLDITRESCRLTDFADVADEARRFLHLPKPPARSTNERVASGSPESARRLFGMARLIRGTLAETYLAARGIADLADTDCSASIRPATIARIASAD